MLDINVVIVFSLIDLANHSAIKLKMYYNYNKIYKGFNMQMEIMEACVCIYVYI